MKDFNIWKVSTWILIVAISLFFGVTSQFRFHDLVPFNSIRIFIGVSFGLFIAELPYFLELAVKKIRGGKNE
ncbi:hypothetical protein [Liquorilactobacillus satsumensis]|uniref:hypothetical protein n=1 Tax=Liquorilactobacillus satsumensis TaxID=259059 RepID=UPI0039EAB46E